MDAVLSEVYPHFWGATSLGSGTRVSPYYFSPKLAGQAQVGHLPAQRRPQPVFPVGNPWGVFLSSPQKVPQNRKGKKGKAVCFEL